eukprot:scaffold19455_cov129-Isochrysis_galbana.AAC.3
MRGKKDAFHLLCAARRRRREPLGLGCRPLAPPGAATGGEKPAGARRPAGAQPPAASRLVGLGLKFSPSARGSTALISSRPEVPPRTYLETARMPEATAAGENLRGRLLVPMSSTYTRFGSARIAGESSPFWSRQSKC